jgi:hypothetical protein
LDEEDDVGRAVVAGDDEVTIVSAEELTGVAMLMEAGTMVSGDAVDSSRVEESSDATVVGMLVSVAVESAVKVGEADATRIEVLGSLALQDRRRRWRIGCSVALACLRA